MQPPRKIRQGEIYWIDEFPPLDGHVAKRRPVVVVGRIDPSDPTSPVLAVGISHTASTLEQDPDRVRLPDLQQNPQVKTGLQRSSWALPRWSVVVESHRFVLPCGHIKGQLLRQLVAAVYARRAASGDKA